MPIVKKRNQQTDARLLLESNDPVELPPAEIETGAVLVQFDKFKPFVPELLEALRAGTMAEPIPVMMDGSTFAVHARTRTFWVKLWHANGSDMTRIERAQIISCLPTMRGMQVKVSDDWQATTAEHEEELMSDEELSDEEVMSDE
ncbi:MAG: hypothetical protein QOF02_4117 [Blastocatellia bacterium]|jgi:hypothetical protein|nr:hypothetical protein [Blastocatellia bacterium]